MYKKMPQVKTYINERLAGANKQESAIKAGYSPAVARNSYLIENTQRYQEKVQVILHNNVDNLSTIMDIYREIINTTPVDLQKAYLVTQIAEKQTKIHDVLTPKITLKESTDKNGNITRTAWAQNASQVQEVMTNEQGIEEEK